MTIEMMTREENGQEALDPDQDRIIESSTRGDNPERKRTAASNQQEMQRSPCVSELRQKQIHSGYIFCAFIFLVSLIL